MRRCLTAPFFKHAFRREAALLDPHSGSFGNLLARGWRCGLYDPDVYRGLWARLGGRFEVDLFSEQRAADRATIEGFSYPPISWAIYQSFMGAMGLDTLATPVAFRMGLTRAALTVFDGLFDIRSCGDARPPKPLIRFNCDMATRRRVDYIFHKKRAIFIKRAGWCP